MTADHKRRSRRRKLNAHDRGENRHNHGTALLLKQQRKNQEKRGFGQIRGLKRLRVDDTGPDESPSGHE